MPNVLNVLSTVYHRHKKQYSYDYCISNVTFYTQNSTNYPCKSANCTVRLKTNKKGYIIQLKFKRKKLISCITTKNT